MADPHEIEFHCAAITGNMAVVDRYLAREEDQEAAVTATAAAAANNNPRSSLIASQAFAGHTILHGACHCASIHLVRKLLSRQKIRTALINAKDTQQGQTPLHLAVAKGDYDLFDILRKAGADITMTDDYNRTILHSACRNASAVPLALVQAILDAMVVAEHDNDNQHHHNHHTNSKTESCPIHRLDRLEKSPLHYAADNGHVALVELLLSREDCRRRSTFMKIPPTYYWNWCPRQGAVDGMSEQVFDSWRLDQMSVYKRILPLLYGAGMDIVMCPGKDYFMESSLSVREKNLCLEFDNFLQHVREDPATRFQHAAARNDIASLQQMLLTQDNSSSSSSSSIAEVSSSLVSQHGKNIFDWALVLGKACRYGHVEASALLMDLAPVETMTTTTPLALVDYKTTMLCADGKNTCCETTPLQVALGFEHFGLVREMVCRMITSGGTG